MFIFKTSVARKSHKKAKIKSWMKQKPTLEARLCVKSSVAAHWVKVAAHRAAHHYAILNWRGAHRECGALGLCRGTQGKNT